MGVDQDISARDFRKKFQWQEIICRRNKRDKNDSPHLILSIQPFKILGNQSALDGTAIGDNKTRRHSRVLFIYRII